MNSKGQVGIITFLFSMLVFIILYAMFFASWLNDWGQRAITMNNLTGFEAFFYANINTLVIIVMILSIIGYMYIGARQ